MQATPPERDAEAMRDEPQDGSIRLVIVLTRADPIEGELLEPSGLAAQFRGWLALATLIESARTAPAEHQGGSPM
jgi:hypothetical protein